MQILSHCELLILYVIEYVHIVLVILILIAGLFRRNEDSAVILQLEDYSRRAPRIVVTKDMYISLTFPTPTIPLLAMLTCTFSCLM